MRKRMMLIGPLISITMFCTIAFLAIPSLLSASLLSPAHLKAWIDNGYIDDWGRKVVILDTGFDVTSVDPLIIDNRHNYDAGHIPGAYYVSPSLLSSIEYVRTDGPINVGFMVPSGATMDEEIVQKWEIDKHTAVVFTGNTMWGPTRYYWTFRYWGFKKNQLFILNGVANGYYLEPPQPPTWRSVWEDAGYVLETDEPPQPTPSTFSVCEWPGNMDTVRASTEEFFTVAEGAIPNTIVVDARPEYSFLAQLPLIPFETTNIFAFQVKNSIWLEWSEFLVGGESDLQVFKSEQDITALLNAKGITESMKPYSFCQGGGAATVNFFVFDALLDRPAKIHDGSSLELGNLGYLYDPAGPDKGLPANSPWRFDQPEYCSIINYNDPSIAAQPWIVDAYALSANLVNEEDKDYYCNIGTFCRGLADFDQDVDGEDLTVFLSQFGRGTYSNPCPPDGPAPVGRTGQTTSYGTGDDGELETGVAWPNPRFTDNGNGTVTDNLTGLIWLKDANCFGLRTWDDALYDCLSLQDGNCGLTDDSHPWDWRLPNRFELESLLDLAYYDPAVSNTAGTGKWTADDPFTNLQSYNYWSSTTYAAMPSYMHGVNIHNGINHFSLKTHNYHVWPVRGGH